MTQCWRRFKANVHLVKFCCIILVYVRAFNYYGLERKKEMDSFRDELVRKISLTNGFVHSTKMSNVKFLSYFMLQSNTWLQILIISSTSVSNWHGPEKPFVDLCRCLEVERFGYGVTFVSTDFFGQHIWNSLCFCLFLNNELDSPFTSVLNNKSYIFWICCFFLPLTVVLVTFQLRPEKWVSDISDA